MLLNQAVYCSSLTCSIQSTLAVELFLNRDMVMAVVLRRRANASRRAEPDRVARPDLLHRPAPTLHPAAPRRHDQVCPADGVPCRPAPVRR